MDVDRLTVAVRPRSPWEAIDLGVALLRREWRAVAASAAPALLLALAGGIALSKLDDAKVRLIRTSTRPARDLAQ